MTGLYDRKPGDKPSLDEHGHPIPDHHHPHDHYTEQGPNHANSHGHGHSHGPGHNSEQVEHEVVWDRWEKKRTFVRALEGTYGELTKALLEQPRVYSSRKLPWKGGPQLYGKHVIS